MTKLKRAATSKQEAWSWPPAGEGHSLLLPQHLTPIDTSTLPHSTPNLLPLSPHPTPTWKFENPDLWESPNFPAPSCGSNGKNYELFHRTLCVASTRNHDGLAGWLSKSRPLCLETRGLTEFNPRDSVKVERTRPCNDVLWPPQVSVAQLRPATHTPYIHTLDNNNSISPWWIKRSSFLMCYSTSTHCESSWWH